MIQIPIYVSPERDPYLLQLRAEIAENQTQNLILQLAGLQYKGVYCLSGGADWRTAVFHHQMEVVFTSSGPSEP